MNKAEQLVIRLIKEDEENFNPKEFYVEGPSDETKEYLSAKFRSHLRNVSVTATPDGYVIKGHTSTVVAPVIWHQLSFLLGKISSEYPLAAIDFRIVPLHDPDNPTDETEVTVNIKRSVPESLEEADEEEDFKIDLKELHRPLTEFIWLHEQMNAGHLGLSCHIERHSHHYVHERSTSVEMEGNWAPDVAVLDKELWEKEVNLAIDTLEKHLEQVIVVWNKEIYKNLETEWDYMHSDAQIEDSLRTNEYDFDEDGSRYDDDDRHAPRFKYDQLNERAKKRARDWYREGIDQNGYPWYDYIIDDWKTRLAAKGFEDVDIQFSGFYSQGDGASFTGYIDDWDKFFNGPNPLTYHQEVQE